MILDAHTGLVLEGGGMRGVFTAGALDFLMDKRFISLTRSEFLPGRVTGFPMLPVSGGGRRRVILICWISTIISVFVIFSRNGVS